MPKRIRFPSPATSAAKPYSTDANLLHISYEGKALEDPWVEADEDMYTRSVDPRKAPDEPEYVEIEFEKGDAIAVNGVALSASQSAGQAQ